MMKLPNIKEIASDRVKLSYAAGFLALTVFAYVLLVIDDLGTLRRLRRNHIETATNLDTLKRTSDYISYLSGFDSRFAAQKGANWVIEVVTALAKAERVTLEFLRPVETLDVSGYKVVRVMAEGGAPYPRLVAFIHRLENHEKLFYIEEFSLSSRGAYLAAGSQRAIGGFDMAEMPAMPMMPTAAEPQKEMLSESAMEQPPGRRVTKFKMIITTLNKEQ